MAARADLFDHDVIVIGSGPTGATMALALATYGVRVHLISRSNWLADTPRAHITNLRTMEVFRALGVEQEVLRTASPWEVMGDTLFTTSLAGEELVRLRTWGTGDRHRGEYMKASPCGMVDIIQPKLEPILFNNAAARGATFAFNTEYLSHIDNGEGVTVRLRDRLAARDYDLRARYLFAADGARSSVVEALDLPIEGHMARAGTVYTNFSADLSRFVGHRPSILNWIVTPNASFGEIGMGLLRAVEPWTRWIAGWGFDLAKGDPDVSEETIRAGIAAMIGDPGVDITLGSTSIWYVNQAYATRYHKGRVFCGGDAVHRHPPSSGLGMNTCVQDAYNLAWKLAFVIKGHAGPALLESYSDERAPVGKQIVLRANQSRLDYAPLNACFRDLEAPNPVAAGIARFKDPGPDGVAARLAVQAALDLKNREFNALGVELNQRYRSTAIIPASDTGLDPEVGDPELDLRATTTPGAKLPHAWLIDDRGRRISTLDIVRGGEITLLTGLSGGVWADAAARADLPYLRCVTIGAIGVQDVYFEWQRIREIEEGGALLVRPDGHVAWRWGTAVQDDKVAFEMVWTALQTILALPDTRAACDQPPRLALEEPRVLYDGTCQKAITS